MNKKFTCIFVCMLLSANIVFSITVSADEPDIVPGTFVSASVECENYGTYDGDVTVELVDGDAVRVFFDPALPDQDCCDIMLSGDIDASFQVRTLVGDINHNGVVSSGDMDSIANKIGNPLTPDNFIYDIDTNGFITEEDRELVQGRIGNRTPDGSHRSESIVSAQSCHTHSDAGEFCLNLTDYNVEMRLPGVTEIEFNFSTPIEPELVMSVSPSIIAEGEPFNVTVTADDEPIEDVEVTFNGDTSYTEDGMVSFTAPEVEEDTEFIITAAKDGYITAETAITVEDVPDLPQLFVVVDDTVVDEGTEFVVTVVVTTGAPVEGADVTVDGKTQSTDANGQVTFTAPEVISDKTYTITATKEGYIKGITTITALNIEEIILKGQIVGTVSNESGSPIEDVEICISTEDTIPQCIFTDEYGVYISPHIPIGTYAVTASKDGYESSTKSYIIVGSGNYTRVDFILLEGHEEPKDETPSLPIDYALQYGIEAEKVFGGIDIREPETKISTYNEAFNIQVTSTTENKFSCIVSGPEGAVEKVFTVRFGPGTLEDMKHIEVKYDGEIISLVDFDTIFNSNQESTTDAEAQWTSVLAIDSYGKQILYVLIWIPHFSEHTITILSVVEEIVQYPGIAVAIAFIAIAVAAFVMFRKGKEEV